MFKTKTTRDHEQAIALIGLVGALADATAGGKGRSAERLEAMAQVIAALRFSAESIKSVAVDWKTVYVGGTYELVPVLKMVSTDGDTKEIEQVENS